MRPNIAWNGTREGISKTYCGGEVLLTEVEVVEERTLGAAVRCRAGDRPNMAAN